jgi:flagellar biogenesis protein FliO
MIIEDISFGQALTAVSFIALLVFAQFYIIRNKSKLKSKWSLNKRIQVIETLRLGPNEKVQIINVDKTEYLYFFTKGNQPVVIPKDDKVPQMQPKISSNTTTQKISNKKNQTSIKIAPSESGPLNLKPENKMMQAISLARKLNPKVSFE